LVLHVYSPSVSNPSRAYTACMQRQLHACMQRQLRIDTYR